MKNNKYLIKALELFGDDLVVFTKSSSYSSYNTVIDDEIITNKNSRKFSYKNNYLYLYENGYNSLSFIFDDTPFGKNISRGEWENIIPYWLKKSNPIAWQNFCNKRLEFIEYNIKIELSKNKNYKKIKKISDCKSRVRSRVSNYINPYFITITFSDESLSKDFKRIIRETLKKYCIRYCLITDYGKNGRIHYHGFIDIPYSYRTDLLSFFKYNNIGNAIYNFVPLLKLGFCTCSSLDDFESSLSYCLKYSLKDEISHTLLCSRF